MKMRSPFRTTPAFLNSLKYRFPQSSENPHRIVTNNPWYIIAAATYSSSNLPEGVADVWRHVSEDLRQCDSSRNKFSQFTLARKMREAVFITGLTNGYPKAINALEALQEAMPMDLHEKRVLRDYNTSLTALSESGEQYFRSLYGDVAKEANLWNIYPDLDRFIRIIAYGLVYGHRGVLSRMETSYALIGSLTACSTNRQLQWHLSLARNGGAPWDDVEAARQVAVDIINDANLGLQHACILS